MLKISIVTVSFNQVRYLRRCLESVAAQGYPNYEHIVVDPGSSDGSLEYLVSQPFQRLKLVLEQDAGPASGLNNGLKKVTGEIFLYLNADDELAPGALGFISDFHASHSEEVLVGNGWIIDINGSPLRHVRSDKFTPRNYLHQVGVVLQQATSFKRSLLERGLIFNESNRISWDAELHFDAWKLGASFVNVDKDLGYFRLQPASITQSNDYSFRQRKEEQRLNETTQGSRGIFLPAVRLARRFAKKISNSLFEDKKRYPFLGLATIELPRE
jgi:glycosyltransferase involved in cell wall biosynthesis